MSKLEITEDYWKELDPSLFNDNVKQTHCDTRDFYCTFNTTDLFIVKDLSVLLKYKNQFFFTIEEVYELLKRLYIESGGKNKWRMLSFKHDGSWFKYFRIYRTDHGYVVGTSFRENHKFYRKPFFEGAIVEQEYLSAH